MWTLRSLTVSLDDPLAIIFLENLLLQLELAERTKPSAAGIDFTTGKLVLVERSAHIESERAFQTYGLALLLGEKPCKVGLVLLESIGETKDGLLAVGPRSLAPANEGFLASVNGSVNVLAGGNGNLWVGLAGGGVDAMSGGLGANELAVDCVEIVGPKVELRTCGTHDCDCT